VVGDSKYNCMYKKILNYFFKAEGFEYFILQKHLLYKLQEFLNYC